MLGDMFPHFSHGLADGNVIVQELTVSSSLPLGESRQLLGDGVEEADDNTNGSRLHVIAELVHGRSVRDAVVAVELHLLPDSEEDGGDHKDRRPVLQTVATVDARVERRQLLEDLSLEFAPHVG